jgi:hypothetical protein
VARVDWTTYDTDLANRFWCVLVQADRVLILFLEFQQSTYEVVADLGRWDRAELERR